MCFCGWGPCLAEAPDLLDPQLHIKPVMVVNIFIPALKKQKLEDQKLKVILRDVMMYVSGWPT